MSNLYPINCVYYCEYLEYSKDCYGTPFEFCDLCSFGCEKFCDFCGRVKDYCGFFADFADLD